jgi:MFS family permease
MTVDVPQPSSDRPPTTVLDTVVTAYYPRAIAAADSARNRAQAGYAIASGIASGLVLAGVFTSIDERAWQAKVAGALALFLWIATALLFLYAVSTPVVKAVTEDDLDPDVQAKPGWVGSVLTRAQSERNEVDKRTRRAIWTTIAAVAVTIPAVGVTGFTDLSLDKDEVVLSLTEKGMAMVAELCSVTPDRIEGQLESRTLKRDFVVMTLAAGKCRDTEVFLRIPKQDVLGIASR